jgi:hypothetical protein
VKALIPVAFVAGAAALAHGGSPALACSALACGFVLALVALAK